MELTVISVMVGFLTLVAALTVSGALKEIIETHPQFERSGTWLAAGVSVALMVLGTLLLNYRARAVKRRVPGAKPVSQTALEQA